ncbi:MAG: sigma-70 family RNA polymerase sigma factor [Elusimicrobiota bacterium]
MAKLDSIKIYLKEVSKIPQVSEEELEELIPRFRKGDEKAKERLILGNLRLVISIAKKFNRRGVALNDLIEAGNMGLIAASNKYDPDKGTKFSTYAYDWIKEYIRRAVLSHTKSVHIPVYIYQDLRKIMAAWDKILKNSGQKPSTKDLAEETGIKQKDVKKFRYYIRVFKEIPSLDAPIANGFDIPLKATIAASKNTTPEDAMGIIGVHQQLEELLENVTDREKKIVKLRFGMETTHPHTLKDVGEKLDISRERVRQIQEKALNKLKKAAKKIEKEEEEQEKKEE